MAELLKKGAKMLPEICPICKSPLFEQNGKTWCPNCKREVIFLKKERKGYSKDLGVFFSLKKNLLGKISSYSDLLSKLGEEEKEEIRETLNILNLQLSLFKKLIEIMDSITLKEEKQ